MSRTFFRVAIVLVVIVALALAVPALAKGPGGGGKPDNPGGGGGHTETATNNLSFPVIAADGANPTAAAESLTVPYAGPYDGLTADEIAALLASGPWYAQKTEGNTWAAEFVPPANTAGKEVVVFGVDWGDNIESVKPALGRPYRLETALFAEAAPWAVEGEQMSGYTMAMLANPSSPDEVQGTDGSRYDSDYATITSPKPALSIQRIEGIQADLSWDADLNYWVTDPGVIAGETFTITFAPELNVGGKYIFGASTGGWKPTALGTYRLTFYIPDDSQITMATTTTLGNLVGGVWESGTAPEQGADPQLDAYCLANNLTYVDVEVVGKGGGGGKPQ